MILCKLLLMTSPRFFLEIFWHTHIKIHSIANKFWVDLKLNVVGTISINSTSSWESNTPWSSWPNNALTTTRKSGLLRMLFYSDWKGWVSEIPTFNLPRWRWWNFSSKRMTRWTSYRYVQNINEHMKLDQSFQLYITSASLQLCVSYYFVS